MKDTEDNLFVGAIAGAIGGVLCLIGALIYWAAIASERENREWQEFSGAHHCKIVEKRDGNVSIGSGYVFGANGKGGVVTTTSVSPSKTGWLCSDGVTYWK